MYDLTQLTLQDVTEIGTHLRQLGRGAGSIEALATASVEYLQKHLIDPKTGEPACALARCFQTHRYSCLPSALQSQVQGIVEQSANVPSDMTCLTLMGTTGVLPDWCERTASKGHQVIPLLSEESVAQIPMISQLIKGLGLEVKCVLSPNDHLLDSIANKTCNVFHVGQALGSEYIPSQRNFVEPFGIESVVGFGGMLPSGNLFAVILFTTVPVPRQTARLLKTLPLNIKMAMMPLLNQPSFEAIASH